MQGIQHASHFIVRAKEMVIHTNLTETWIQALTDTTEGNILELWIRNNQEAFYLGLET